MRPFLLLLLFASAGLVAVRAQEPGTQPVRLSRPATRAELIGVVTAQLDAIRAEQWTKAYGLAAPSFQNLVTPAAFMTLITRNYPVVWKNTRAEFGLPSDNGALAVVPVRVFGQNTSEAYDWLLAKTPDGWRVTGVVPQKTSGGA